MGLDQYVYCNSKKVKRDVERVMDEHTREWYHDNWYTLYWRKANAIHKWIVDHCFYGEYEEYRGDYIDVEVGKLLELKAACETVLASSELVEKDVEVAHFEKKDDGEWGYVKKTVKMKVLDNDCVAKELLPTQEGFFFGTYQYDEWYVADLKWTVEQIEALTEHLVKKKDCKDMWEEWYHEDEPDWAVRLLYCASW